MPGGVFVVALASDISVSGSLRRDPLFQVIVTRFAVHWQGFKLSRSLCAI
jgi:hypothetical protein